ncbi:MAG TPA: hypothetical protein VNC15_06460 [Solirubrobacterales bacterium]|nr:hypothetical protein [Solirubrobacterales bacterium]
MATGTNGPRPAHAGAVRGAGPSTPVLLLLTWLFGASAFLLLYLGSKLTFLLDDWEFLLYRHGVNADSVLDPHGEHIVALPVLIYKALLATVGMGSALPYRVVSVGLFLLSAALLFVYLRRRVGDWPALAATAIVLFLGVAWEDLLWSFQMTYFGAVAAGLGALLALEREDRRGEALACALLVVSILFSSLGLSFAIGAAVHVLLLAERRRRLYVFLVPLAVYALWWLGWGHTAESSLSFHNLVRTPLYVLDGLANSVGSATGLVNDSVAVHDRLFWSRPLAVALVFLAAWRLYRLPRVPHWFWVVLATGGSFWILAGFNQMPGREADASRYQYLGVVFGFMLAAEVLRPELERGLRIGRTALAAIAVVTVFSVAGNLDQLHDAYEGTYHPISQLEKAGLGALDITEATVDPGFVLSEDVVDTGFVNVDAGSYFAARDKYGSPAYSETEIAAAPQFVRYAADKVLFGALAIELETLRGAALTRQLPTKACETVTSEGGASPLLQVPPGGILIRAGRAPIERFEVSRFSAGSAPVLIAGIGVGEAGRLAIPPDKAKTPWKLRLITKAPALVCDADGKGNG